MAHTLTSHYGYIRKPGRKAARQVAQDPLGAVRGIVTGVLVSILGFWLPLVFALTLAR
jgi:hypothetical protein